MPESEPDSSRPSRRPRGRRREAAGGTPRAVRQAMSAGGVVYRERDGRIEVVLVARPVREHLDPLPLHHRLGHLLVQKVVHHFLFEPVGGDVTLHDHEYDVVDWVDIHEAPARMTYANERSVVERASVLIAELRADALEEAGA